MLWHGEMSSLMRGARRNTRALVMILAMPWMKLMSLKSPMVSVPSFLGMRMMFALLSRFRSWLHELYRESMAAMMSSRIISQHFLKKSPVKLSGPGALSWGIRQIACQTSS